MDYGMQVFSLIWFSQLVSLIGSGLTNFSLGIWVYQRAGSATQFALISLFTVLPSILTTPLVGALVDRWKRRWVMLFSDVGAAMSTLAIALLLFAGRLEVWRIYFCVAVSSIFSTFQWLAHNTTMTLLVPKRHLGRASGMMQMARASSRLISSMLAGVLVVAIQIQGIILIHCVTFLVVVTAQLCVRFPKPQLLASVAVFCVAIFIFIYFFGVTIINASTQAIWLSKVAPTLQGRDFAMRNMVAWVSLALAYLIAGPADQVFEPLLAIRGPLAGSIEQIIGVGQGNGISSLFVVLGILTMLATFGGYLYLPLWLLKEELPDAIGDNIPSTAEMDTQNYATEKNIFLQCCFDLYS